MGADVAVIDYRIGNLPSVERAVARAGANTRIVTSPADLGTPDGLVLPGVGNFGAGSRNLTDCGLSDVVKDWIFNDRPFLGICVGMQLLFDASTEDHEHPGLGIFNGTVQRLAAPVIPHMGWNVVEAGPAARLSKTIDTEHAYFLHSYVGVPTDPTVVALTSEHGERFCAAVERGRLLATQFHPEKSSDVGYRLLSAWVNEL